MLGYTGVQWQSAISPPMPPRKNLTPLIGEFRRMPVSQIGADFFCDTRLISDEISQLSGNEALSYSDNSSEVKDFINQLGSEYFMGIVQTGEPKTVLKKLITRHLPWTIVGLMRDRAGVAKNTAVKPPKRSELHKRNDEFKELLENRLTEQAYLSGDQVGLSDFAAYHLVWFADLTRSGEFLANHPKARSWQQKMTNFGHGKSNSIGQKKVFAEAKNQPRPLGQSEDHALLNTEVIIQPDDYAREGSNGVLVYADSKRLVLARETLDCGTIHLHFPTHGYLLTAAS